MGFWQGIRARGGIALALAGRWRGRNEGAIERTGLGERGVVLRHAERGCARSGCLPILTLSTDVLAAHIHGSSTTSVRLDDGLEAALLPLPAPAVEPEWDGGQGRHSRPWRNSASCRRWPLLISDTASHAAASSELQLLQELLQLRRLLRRAVCPVGMSRFTPGFSLRFR